MPSNMFKMEILMNVFGVIVMVIRYENWKVIFAFVVKLKVLRVS